MSVTVLVDDKLWTDESVLLQNKLRDRAEYEVIYRTSPEPQPRRHKQDRLSDSSSKIGKPRFFRFVPLC